MADLRITDLTALPEAGVAATDVLPIADVSASETKKVTAKDLVEAGVALIDDASIPSAKLAAITPANLGNSSAAAQFIAGPTATTGAFAARTIAAGDLPLATNADAGAVVVGTGLSVTTGTVSAAVATSSTRGAVSVPSASGLSVDGSGVLSHQSSVTAQTKNGFTVNSTGHVTAVGSIASTDLPLATTTDVGGIFVGSGLAVTVAGELNHADSIAASTISGITYNASGHITAVTALVDTDLPVATSSTIGAISIAAGALSVDGAGALTHSNSAVTPGTYPKVTVDARGHVTAGTTLSAADIPELSAAKITSGAIPASLLGTNTVTGVKLADSSTVQFGGAGSTSGVVTFPTAEFKGQYFWDELNDDLYLWSGSAWLPVTITSGELVYGGTYDASVNQVASVTSAGSAVGLTVGSALPAASDTNNRYYLVVSDAGTGSGNAPAEALAPPDMILSNGATWDLIDVSNAIAGQAATNISFTPYGGIAATNVQLALQELDDEKLSASGGTMTGVLEIGTTGTLRWEGSTADDYETSIAVVDPTADRTITLPDVTGTVITTGDTGTVTNTMLTGSIADSKLSTISTANKVGIAALDIDGGTDIGAPLADADLFVVDDGASGANRKAAATRITDYAFGKVSGDITISSGGTAAIGSGVIVNADINASAEIAVSKLADGSARQLLQTDAAGTGVEWASNIDVPGTLDVTGAATFDSSVAVTGTLTKSGSNVVTVGDSGTVTSTMILDGTIVNADVNASAAIAGTKISPDFGSQTIATTGVFRHALGAAATPSITFTGDLNTGIYSPGADQVAISTNGTERMRLDSSGRLGLGTSAPDSRLNVRAGADNAEAAEIASFSRPDAAVRAAIAKGLIGGTTNGIAFGTTTNHPFALNTNGTERIYITQAGNVGIGTTSPSVPLEVSAASTVQFRLVRPTGVDLRLNSYFGNSDLAALSVVTNHPLAFHTNNTERARIDSSGRLLVGTSSAFGTGNLQVFGSSNTGTYTNNAFSSNHVFIKSRSTTVGGVTVVQSNDELGGIIFQGTDGSANVSGARIFAAVDGTPGANDMPGRLVFSTTADSAASPTERLRINSSGAFGIEGANFGSAGQVLVSNGSSAAPSWEQITPTVVFGWDHDDDTYGLYLPGTSIKVSNLTGTVDIDVQSRIRRCVINDSGVVQYYLDADDSDLESGDWLRIVETEALDTAYTGTISESTNSLLRVGVPAWAAGTFTLGQRVTHSGSLWECIAATTTATPGAGTVSSDLTGTDGQVVVEIPAFSVRYGFLNGVHTREVKLGCNDALIAQGFQPHPAFIKTDGSYKDAFYIGAYHTYDDSGTGSSVSGQTNTRSQTRDTFRTEAVARGTGWHVLSYLELAAIQTLLVCEYQDYNSQRAIGNGSDAGTTYGVTTGQSDGDGNHSVNSTDNASVGDDYMAYRGIENLYGRAWQFVDGINVYERVVYLTNDQTAFDDDTSDGYEFYAQVPSGLASYQKELQPLADVFLPSVVTGGSDTTYLGDAFWTSTGWRVAYVGGSSVDGARVGAFCLYLRNDSGVSASGIGSRLAYAAN